MPRLPIADAILAAGVSTRPPIDQALQVAGVTPTAAAALPASTPAPSPGPQATALPTPTPAPTPAPGEQPQPTAPDLTETQQGAQRELGIALQGMRQGSTGFFDLLQGTADKVADTLGMPQTKGAIFRSIADLSRVHPEEAITPDSLAEQITERVYGAIGGDLAKVVLATHAGGPVAGFAGLGALESWVRGDPPKEILKEAVKQGLMGEVFSGAGVLTRPVRVATMATIAGGQTALEGGSPADVAASATTLGLLSAIEGGGVSPRQSIDDLRRYGGVDISGKVERGLKALKGPETAGTTIDPSEAPIAQQASPGAAAAPESAPRPGIREGSAFSIEHPDQSVNFRYDVVPLDDLQVNHPSVQTTRNRSRFASTEQVERNARDFNGNRFVAGNTELDRGLPIVGADNIVESGNGRAQTLQRLRDSSPDKFLAFSDMLKSRAQEFGIDPAEFQGIKDPVIVRRRTTTDDELARIYGVPVEEARARFADDANARTSLGLSATEQAGADARRISEATIANLTVPDSGSIDQALDLAGNRRIVGEFIDSFPEADRGAMLTADGRATPEAKARIKKAILSWVFPGEEGARLVQTAAEAPEGSVVKNVEAGIYGSLARLAELKTKIGRGELHPIDITDEIPRAVATLARMRGEGWNVDDFFRQQELGQQRSAVEEELVRGFNSAKSAKQVREFLSKYIDTVEALGHPQQVDMLRGGPLPTKEEILRQIQKRPAAAEASGAEPGQGAMFYDPSVADSPEAIRRTAEERAAGVEYSRHDVRRGRGTALAAGVDRVDVRPGPHDVILRRGGRDGAEILDQGERVSSAQAERARARYEEEGAAARDTVNSERPPASTGSVSTFGIRGDTPEGKAEIIKRSAIVKDLEQKLGVPIRVGRLGSVSRTVAGFFKIKPEVIRSRLANDIRTVAHEIGHFLDKTVFGGGQIKGSTFARFRDELLPIASKPRAGQAATPEGFAEFVAFYITDPAKAQTVAPRTYDFFDGTLKEQHPEVREVLLKAREDYRRWQEQPAVAKILSQMSINEKPHKGISRSDVYTAAVDDLHALDQLVTNLMGTEQRGKTGARIPFSNVPASANPYIVARVFRGWVEKAASFISGGGALNFNLDVMGKSYKEILAPVVSRLDDYRAYMTARRSLEMNRQGRESGISAVDSHAALEQLDNSLFRETFDAMREWRGHLRRYLVDSGILSPQSLASMERMHEDYVPFHRVIEEQIAGAGGGGSTFANLFNPIKRMSMRGSARDIVDPIESDIKNAYAFVNVAERNEVGRSLLRLADKTDGAGKFIERIPTPLVPVPIHPDEFARILAKYSERVVSQEVKEKITSKETSSTTGAPGETTSPASKIEERVREALIARGFSTGETEQFINRLKGAKSEDARQTIIKQVVEKIRQVEIKSEIELGPMPNPIVEIFRPSQNIPKDAPIVRIYTNGKGELYQLSQPVYDAMLNLDREQTQMLVRALSIPARLLRLGATTLSPEFTGRNVVRDQFTALTQSRYGYTPVNFIQGLFHMLKQDDVAQEFHRSGAMHSMLVSMDRDYLQSGVRDITEKAMGKLEFVIRHPIETAKILSELGEEPTRMGEFLLAKRAEEKRGASGRELLTRAAFAAREVTVDFNRIGAKMKAVNALIAFFNPNVQGVNRAYRAFVERPLGMTAMVMSAVTIPSVGLWLANHDDGRVKELPQWQRDLFFIVPTGPHMASAKWNAMTAEDKADFSGKHPIWRIPKPFELGVLFGSLPERILDYLDTHHTEQLSKWIPNAIGALSPSMIPTFALPIVENAMNWSEFTGRPIVPRGKEDLEAALQKSGYTSELATKIGQAIDYSPAKIENLIRGWTGGGGIVALDTIDQFFRLSRGISNAPARPAISLADIPGIRGFAVRFPTANAESIQTFYEYFGESQKALKTFDALKRAGDGPGADAYLADHRGPIMLSAPLSAVAKALTGYRAIESHLYESKELGAQEKRRALDATTFEMIEAARRTLENIYAFEQEYHQ